MKNLLIRIVDIPETGMSIEREDSPGVYPILRDLEITEDCKFISPINLSVAIKSIGKMYRISGSINTNVRLNCSRCLSKFEKHLSEVFDMTFAPSDSDTTDEGEYPEKELTAEEIGKAYFDGDEIDLKDTLQQQLVMSLAQRPLCTEVCKGLCQTCGANLNDEDCRCTKDQIDDRFEILKSLKLE